MPHFPASLTTTQAIIPIQSKLFRSKDGTEIYAQVAGNRSKPHVVFIHGLSLSAMAFSKQFADEMLLENIYLVAYDMRGHGRSGMPNKLEAYKSTRIAEDFMAVADGFRLKKPFLAGWSMGATIAADVCTTYGPSLLSGIIYLAGLPYIGDIQPKIGTPLVRKLVQNLIGDDVSLAFQAVVDFVESFVVDPVKIPFETKAGWVGCVALQSPSVRKCVLERSQNPNRLLQEGGKQLPLLLLHGSQDSQIRGEALIEEMQPVFADFEGKLILNAGHAVFWDQPERVREEILGFVARVTAAK